MWYYGIGWSKFLICRLVINVILIIILNAGQDILKNQVISDRSYRGHQGNACSSHDKLVDTRKNTKLQD